MNILYMILAAIAAAAAGIHYLLHRDTRARLTLANDINSGTHPDGIVTGTTDAALGRYRLVKQGAGATTFAVAGAADTPIGITLDETANTTDLTAVRLLGCGQGTVMAISDGSAGIARGDILVPAASGACKTIAAGAGNYRVCGIALEAVGNGAAGTDAQFEMIPLQGWLTK